jgi:hypothetical protein
MNSLISLLNSLTLRELESFSSLSLPVLFPFNHSSIASQQSVDPEGRSVFVIERTQSAGNPKPYRTCLPAGAATLDIRNDIILPKRVCDLEGLDNVGSESLKWEVVLYGFIVNRNLSGTGEQPNSCNSVLSATHNRGWM